MQAIGPATAFHQTSGEIVDDDYFAVLHDVLVIEPVEGVRFQSLLDAMQQLHVCRIIEIANAQQTFSFIDAIFGQDRRVVFSSTT